jgi:pimeloyl-ACP methyl ester carboxylesterase
MAWKLVHKVWCAISLALGTVLLQGAGTGHAQAEAHGVVDSQTYSRPGQLIAVDGKRRLNLLCMGEGSPVVVLEAGAGDGTGVWRQVQGEIAKFTRVCAYDRAGYGWSDPISRPSDARNAVADLQALLKRAGLRAPIVLVGHSVGGLYAQLFAATHPHQIAGMVLVDPTGLDDFRLVTKITTDEERLQQREGYLKRMASYALCLDRDRRGVPLGPAGSECAPPATGDAVMDGLVRLEYAQPKYYEAYQSEMKNFYPNDYPMGLESVTTSQVRSHPLSLGDKPFILLMTPGRVPPGERGEHLRAWSTAVAEKLVTASSRGKLVKVSSGHYVHVEHPEVVIDAVRQVVGEARATEVH